MNLLLAQKTLLYMELETGSGLITFWLNDPSIIKLIIDWLTSICLSHLRFCITSVYLLLIYIRYCF